MRKIIQVSLTVLAVVATFSLASGAAFAGTYEDNVFRKGEPRYGSPINTYEDRNVRHHRRAKVDKKRLRRPTAGQQRGHNRAEQMHRSKGTEIAMKSYHEEAVRKTGSFRVLIGQTVEQCVRSRITGEIRC